MDHTYTYWVYLMVIYCENDFFKEIKDFKFSFKHGGIKVKFCLA